MMAQASYHVAQMNWGILRADWESNSDLGHFVHQTVHARFMKKRADWFVSAKTPRYVIRPVAKGHMPSLTEAKDKLDLLTAQGAGEDAYDFKYLSQKRSQTEAV